MPKLGAAVLTGAVLLLATYWGDGPHGTAIPVGRASNPPEREAHADYRIADQASPESLEPEEPEEEQSAEMAYA